jgi:hypothetical protein
MAPAWLFLAGFDVSVVQIISRELSIPSDRIMNLLRALKVTKEELEKYSIKKLY